MASIWDELTAALHSLADKLESDTHKEELHNLALQVETQVKTDAATVVADVEKPS